MAALGKAIVAMAGAWPGVLTGRVVDRLGKGLRGVPRDALLIDGIEAGSRGKVFGFHRTMDTFGAVIGPLLGLVGYQLLDQQIAPLLYIAIVPAVLSVLLITLVREKPRSGPRPARQPFLRGVGELPSRFWRVTAVVVGFGLVNFPDALLLLRLNEIGFGVVEVILAYVTYNLVYALASFPAGMLADRLPRSAVFGIGLVFFAVGYIGLGMTSDPVLAWLLIGVYGLFTACTDGVGKAWVSALAGADQQATAQGAFQGGSGLAILVAGVWAGLLWGDDGRLPLLVSGIVGACFAAALLGRWALVARR
jgi:MFS family permease